MIKNLLAATTAALFVGALFGVHPTSAQALKTAGACADEYKSNKGSLKDAKEKKKDFITACRATPAGVPTPIGGSAAPTPGPGNVPPAAPTRTSTVSGLKTAGACDDEYKANKGALKDAKEKKKDFMAACRALPPGTATPINGGAAAPAPTPTPTAPAAPTPKQPAPQRTQVPPPATQRTPTASSSPSAANQFSTDGAAKSRCPGQTIVWVNTKSGVYHFAGTKNYGNTKSGAYMCESDATAAGDRASKTEKHP